MLNPDEKCILCGGAELQKLFRPSDRNREVVRCVRCGLAWKKGIPSRWPEQRIQELEKPRPLSKRPAALCRIPSQKTAVAVTSPEIDTGADNPVGVPSTSFTSPQICVEEMEEIGLFKKPPGTLLTVGPDPGDLLETSRVYGWSPLRLDRINEDEPTQETGTPKSPRKTTPDSGHRKYDVIRLCGSLENALDPCAYLKGAGRILGSAGLLVISVPDLSRWDFPLYGQGASSYPVDLSNWFFTRETLIELLGRCGFKVLKVSAVISSKSIRLHPETTGASHPIVARIARIYGEGSSESFDLPLADKRVPQSLSFLSGGHHFRVFARRDERRVPAALRSKQSRTLPAENPVEVFA